MNLIRGKSGDFTLMLTESQLKILLACTRESFANINTFEYALRIGAPIQAASELAKELFALMSDIGIDQ